MRVILASQSPRRKEFLEKMGVKFEVITADCEEVIKLNLTYYEVAKDISKQKAQFVFEKTKHLGDRLIIGSDTTVVYGGEIMGKPKNKADALNMLKKLNGNKHYVYTGLCVIVERNGKVKQYLTADKVTVYFKNISEELLEKYVNTGEPMDKAGSYMLQGRAGNLINKISGHPASVVGLPIHKLFDILQKEEIEVFNFEN